MKEHFRPLAKIRNASRINQVIALVVTIAVAFVGYSLLISRAAGPFASLESEQGTLSTAAKIITDTTASAGRAIQFGAGVTTPPPPPPPATWPNATNTGYKNAPGFNTSENPNGAGKLGTFSGTVQSNTTYKFMHFPGGAEVPATASNVTFYGCRFSSNDVQDANVRVFGDKVTFDYSSFEPSAAAAPPVAYNKGYQYGISQPWNGNGQITVDHSDFWGWGNGIEFHNSTQAKPFIVRNTWFHDARDDGGGVDHTDGILSNNGGPSYMVFDHNTIASKGNTQGLALQTEKGDSPYHHVTITNNYFSGFGYTVAIGEDLALVNNVTFTGNTFGTDFKPVFGTLYESVNWSVTAGNTWRNNKWRIAPGTTWSAATNDGKYWLPGGSLSATDYNK